MATLKELRIRKRSVQATKKITMAMKMIAAAKLKKAQKHAEAARCYADALNQLMHRVLTGNDHAQQQSKLLNGVGDCNTHLIICMTSDRGLCGGFNSGIVRQTHHLIHGFVKVGRHVKIICVGQKGYDQLKRHHGDKIIDHLSHTDPNIDVANLLAGQLLHQFAQQQFDTCTLVYNRFQTALSSQMITHQLIPVDPADLDKSISQQISVQAPPVIYEYEPSQSELLMALLPKFIATRIFTALLETAASEQGARMTAMDSATRNAQDMISDLERRYNRTRQGQITRELIEIISGADAL